jgi:hypothetical protein
MGTDTESRLPAPKLLDDDDSARVLEEMISLGAVDEKEIDRIMEPGARLTYRECAIALRVSTVLGIPAPFALSPLYAVARELFELGQVDKDDELAAAVSCLLAESMCAGVELLANERESLLLSTLAAFWPDGDKSIEDVLAAIDERIVGQRSGGEA